MKNFTLPKNKFLEGFRFMLLSLVTMLLAFTMQAKANTSVAEVVVNSENHTILEAAVIAAGLAETLSGEGPFTLFAPTDAAFAALPEGTIEALLADPDGLLTQILLYHVLGAEVFSADLENGMTAPTLQGKNVTVTINEDGVFINGALVSVADIVTDNGIVHVIDAVLTPPPGIQIMETQKFGKILTDSRGRTLYFFTPDASGFSGCIGNCLDSWPVFFDANLTLGEGLNNEDFGTITRMDGLMQTTFRGWPLYYSSLDVNPGDINADGRLQVSFVAKPDYTIMVVNNQLRGNDGNYYKGDYTRGYENIQYFTDGKGRTLYTWTRDFQNTNKFTRADFGNNNVWPVYEEDNIVVPSILDASLFSSIDVHGRRQMTYKGWPLYYFGADGNVRGSNKGVSVPSQGVWPVARQNMAPAKPATVVDIVVNSDVHNTLEAAVIAAGLAEALSGEGPFTVFAPTDAAFAALPAGTVETLLQDPSGLLTQILLYHAVSGKVMSTDLSNGLKATTLQGQEITVTINENGVFINDAKVIVADIVAGNGVVHVIDAVLLPKMEEPVPATVVDIVVNSDVHNTLEAAVIAAGLAEALSGEGPFTVFAPTDAAFAALPAGTVETLLQDPSGLLTQILLYHAVSGKVMSTDLSNGLKATTLQGQEITVTINENGVFINDAKVIVADIVAGNGVVHVIDAVLLPAPAVKIAENTNLGKILTDYKGRSLYFLSRDARDISNCTGACLNNWPVFYNPGLQVGEGLNSSDFGTIVRADGMKQTTYKGWPLYYYVQDQNPGDILGDGRSNIWFAAKPDYTIMLVNNQLTGNDGKNYTGNYTEGDEIIQYFTDGKGRTLYTWTRDFQNVNKFTRPDFSNNANWPVYEEDNIVVPSVLDASLFSSIDVHGRKQMTYKGWPLYYFGADGNVRGNNKGVSVPSPGIWPVARQNMAPAKPATVVDIVVNSDVHNTLEAAVVAAGLAEALSGEGPFTVFAPTDAAFAALPAGTVETLLQDPSGLLTQILLYHAVSGKVMSTDLSNGLKATTLQGQEITVTINENGVFINDAKVIVADIVAGNGVVHVIDAVLLPKMEEPVPATVVDIVVNSDVHNTLEAAVIAAGLAEALSGEGPFTVFAPTDAAFAALPAGTVETLLQDPSGLLTQILLYHAVSGKVMSTDLSNGLKATTLQGQEITVTINENGVFINDAKVIVADIVAGNGVVHVIDAVLLPKMEEPVPATVVDIVVNSDVHNTLEAAVIAAGLAEALSGEGPFTVFAPTDAAFAALPAGTVETLLQDPSGLLTQILLYHAVRGKVMSTDLSNGLKATTLQGQEITVTINENGVFINDAKVIVADIVAGNGVVHVIDAVLLPAAPRTTVVDVIVNSENHTTLEAAVVAAGLAEALSGEGPFTVFAPTDAAFAALPAGTVETLLQDPSGLLTQILLYHAVSGKVMSTDLSNGLKATTLQGQEITVTINENGVFINDAKVIVADIVAGNGVVHVIDAVLLPAAPRTTVVDVIVNSENHTTLEAAVVAAGLAEALSGEGPFTVFAPTDAAFATLPAGTVEALLADPKGALTDVLTYHAVAGKVMSTDLQNEQKVVTLSGKIATVTINAQGVFINKAKVTVADIVTDNGVVHVIDAVLLADTPTNVTDITNSEIRFSMYPNPASSMVTFDLSNIDTFAPATLSIFTTDGRMITQIPANDQVIRYDIRNLNNGLYIVVLKQNDRISTEKLIVR